MFLAIVLYGMSNNFHMPVKELCLYAWALHYKGICFEGGLDSASLFIRFVSKEVSTQCHGWALYSVWTLRWREKLMPCRESKPTPTASTQSLYCSYHTLYYMRLVTVKKFGEFRFEPYLSLWNLKKLEMLVYSLLPDFPKSTAFFFKVFRLCPFVLITAACKWRWAWSNGGTILKGETPSTQRISIPIQLFPPKISHGIAQDRTWGCDIICRWLTAIARPETSG